MNIQHLCLTALLGFIISIPKISANTTLPKPATAEAAELVYRKIYPSVTDEVIEKRMPEKGMFHNGETVFIPLGQLDAYGVMSKAFDGILIYSLDKKGALHKSGAKQWDIITSIEGEKLPSLTDETKDGLPTAEVFGNTLAAKEVKGGSLKLEVIRDGLTTPKAANTQSLTCRIKAQGSFNSPLKEYQVSDRSLLLSEKAITFFLKTQQDNGVWVRGNSQVSDSLIGLHLLMAADSHPKHKKRILKALEKAFNNYKTTTSMHWSWGSALSTWFLAEYFWATGDIEAYEALHKHLEILDDAINPIGGVHHRPFGTAYVSINLGGPHGLAQIALKATEKLYCSYNRRNTKDIMDYHIYGSPSKHSPEVSNSVGYGGYLTKLPESKTRDTSFTASVFATGMHRFDHESAPFAEEKKATVDNMYHFFQLNHRQASHIHSTPCLGTIFTSLFFSTVAETTQEAWEKSLVKHRTWQLALSCDSSDNFQYIFPRRARFAFIPDNKGGGGWGGDKALKLDYMTATIALSLIHSSKKNLIINAPVSGLRQVGWLSQTNSKTVLGKIKKFHEENVKLAIKNIVTLSKKGDMTLAAKEVMNFIDSYPPSAFESLYTTKLTATLQKVIDQAVAQKVQIPDARLKESSSFLKKAFGNGKSDEKFKIWQDHIRKYFQEPQHKYNLDYLQSVLQD